MEIDGFYEEIIEFNYQKFSKKTKVKQKVLCCPVCKCSKKHVMLKSFACGYKEDFFGDVIIKCQGTDY